MSGRQDNFRAQSLTPLSRGNASGISVVQRPDWYLQLESAPATVLLSVFAQWIGSNCAQDGDPRSLDSLKVMNLRLALKLHIKQN
jgi:hypothetical protein